MKRSTYQFKAPVDAIASTIAIVLLTIAGALAQPPDSGVSPVKPDPGVEDTGDGLEFGLPSMGAETADSDSVTGGTGDQLSDAFKMLNHLFEGSIEQDDFADIEQIAKLQRELMLLDLEHRKAVLIGKIKLIRNEGNSETASKIDELRSELEAVKGMVNGLNPAADGKGTHGMKPVVLEITGNSSSMEALLLLPGIGPVTARNGSVLPNGMKVESVKLEGVRVRQGRESMLLTVGWGSSFLSGDQSAIPSTGMPSDLSQGAGSTDRNRQ